MGKGSCESRPPYNCQNIACDALPVGGTGTIALKYVGISSLYGILTILTWMCEG